MIESLLATALSRLEAEHGDPLAALDHITLAIRNFYDSGNVAYIRFSLDSRGTPRPPRTPRTGSHHRRFRVQSLGRGGGPTVDHRDRTPPRRLGDQTYESLARKAETMTTSEMATYAYDQIDQARTELEHPS